MTGIGDVEGKRVIVTGGGGGLGPLSQPSCADWARVLVCGRTPATLDAAVARIYAQSGEGHAFATRCAGRACGR